MDNNLHKDHVKHPPLAMMETTEQARQKARILAAVMNMDRKEYITDLIEREFTRLFPSGIPSFPAAEAAP